MLEGYQGPLFNLIPSLELITHQTCEVLLRTHAHTYTYTHANTFPGRRAEFIMTTKEGQKKVERQERKENKRREGSSAC